MSMIIYLFYHNVDLLMTLTTAVSPFRYTYILVFIDIIRR